MFLVEKTKPNHHHFKSLTKKPPQITPNKLSQSFDDVITSHLKTLITSSSSSIVTLSWMSKAVMFLTTVHTTAYNQIHSFRSDNKFESDLMTSYMDYSLKVLEVCNLVTSSVKEMTERKMLMKLALRLVQSGDVVPEKMKKGKENKLNPDERHRFHFFNSFFFRKLADPDKSPLDASIGKAGYQRVKKWTRKVSLFEKDFVFVPVNYK
ncbi:BYPASS-related protein [Artemisia annua]|uniref:BYPASS-related protein n=1 Tax=Artemisia annua TaxID=35608 RepID=A0A2U1KD83_ARTAN|nr:BYPASS-related protein [Artemisia annua]